MLVPVIHDKDSSGASLLARIEAQSGGEQGSSSELGTESEGAGGSGSAGIPLQTGGEDAPLLCKDGQSLDVLFLGNSYTHYFQMPELLVGMAESAGCKVNAEYVAPGGSRLKQHAQSGASLSAIGARDWDAVILQNYSQLPSQPLEAVQRKTLPHVKTLVDAIRDNDPSTEIFYYVTWGRRDGDRKYCQDNPVVCTFQGHTAAVHRGYSFYAEQLGGTLANVGGAFSEVARDRNRPFNFRELYDPDGSHPSLKGSYLAASVFFSTLFRTSPEGLSYPLGLSETSAHYIQRVAATMPVSGA